MSTTPHTSTLAAAAVGTALLITGVRAPATSPEWAQSLDELGFVAGERVQLMARGFPGGDPLVVRVGTSTYALRGAEAACVMVEPMTGEAA